MNIKKKYVFNMFKVGMTDDRVAWYLLMNTKLSNWEQAKQVAKKMRDDYENKNDGTNETANE